MTAGKIGTLVAGLCITALWPVTGRADEAPAIPAIITAVASPENRQVTITGSNFSPSGLPPTVVVAHATLVLVSFDDRSAVANLPADFTPGSYDLAVTNSNNQTGVSRMTLEPLTPTFNKLRFHAEGIYQPWAIAGSLAYAGLLQRLDAPKEWGGGASAYGERLASTLGAVGIHTVLAYGLDSTFHEDPRYFRSGTGGFLHRSAHAVRGTFLTRTDSGGETFSVWRFGSAYGAAFLSNEWYPDRLNTVRLGFLQGSLRIGFDMVANLSAEFWPDIRKKLFHHD
jgi:hypothetical protein